MVENYLGPCFGMMLSILGRKSRLHDSKVLGGSYSWNPLPLSILVKQEAERGPEIVLDTNFKALPGTRDLPLTKLCLPEVQSLKTALPTGAKSSNYISNWETLLIQSIYKYNKQFSFFLSFPFLLSFSH